MDDVIIRMRKMPVCIKGATVGDYDGNYKVYINECLSYGEQVNNRYNRNSDYINGVILYYKSKSFARSERLNLSSNSYRDIVALEYPIINPLL